MAYTHTISLRSFGYSTFDDEHMRRDALIKAINAHGTDSVMGRLQTVMGTHKDGSRAKEIMTRDAEFVEIYAENQSTNSAPVPRMHVRENELFSPTTENSATAAGPTKADLMKKIVELNNHISMLNAQVAELNRIVVAMA